MTLRLLETGGAPGALNMGRDEAVLEAVASGGSPPTLRLYRWEPSCITIGYFQSMRDEVDLGACRALGVDAVRRATGGGAVFHDAEITYSLIVPEGGPLSPPDILESYRLVCGGLVEAMRLLGVSASFAPINDIVAQDGAVARKLSGNAQTRKRGCLLQHGTVLLDVDVERMFSLLKVPSEKLKGKLVEEVKARVTSLRRLLGRVLPWAEAAATLAAGFGAAFARLGVAVGEASGALDPAEEARARELAEGKYSSDAWNLKR